MREYEHKKHRKVKRQTPIKKQPEVSGWFDRFKKRQETSKEFGQAQNRVDFTFSAPTLINLIADWHIGHESTDYKRIEDEVNAVTSTDNSFIILAGDLIDNMNWNPGQFEEMEQTPEQVQFLRSILQFLAKEGRLLHHIQGDHDGWLSKAGMNIQHELPPMGVSVSQGLTYIGMDVQKQHYELAGAHQLPGSSQYNRVHPQTRSLVFGSTHGSDLVFSGHNHQKGLGVTFTHEQGVPKEVTLAALGPYKATDSWLAKKGFAAQQPEEMFGISVYFDGKEHEIVPDMDIVRANHRMQDAERSN